MELPYLTGYPQKILEQTRALITSDRLDKYLLNKYPSPHSTTAEKLLYTYVLEIKNRYMKKAQPLHAVKWDSQLSTLYNALGIHKSVSRSHGKRLKNKREIYISTLFKKAPEAFLRMIAVHELAHLKELDHNKAFYKLCVHMEPNYGQLELDTRLFLTYREISGELY